MNEWMYVCVYVRMYVCSTNTYIHIHKNKRQFLTKNTNKKIYTCRTAGLKGAYITSNKLEVILFWPSEWSLNGLFGHQNQAFPSLHSL